MRLSATAALKTKQSSKRSDFFGRHWQPGDKVRCLYPIFWTGDSWELLTGALWGHPINNPKELGLKATFIPALTERDQYGVPVGDPELTYKFSLIAKAFIEGEKTLETNKIANKAGLTEAMRRNMIQEIEEKFKDMKPVIGRASYGIYTECIIYTVDKPETAALVVQNLSQRNIRRINDIVHDSKFVPVFDGEHEDSFVEIEWYFPSDPNKSESAKSSSMSGLPETERTEYKNPDAWAKIKPSLTMLTNDSEVIAEHAARKIPEADVLKAITQYSVLKSENLDALENDPIKNENAIKSLCRNFDILKSLGVDRTLQNSDLIQELNDAEEEARASMPVDASAPAPAMDTPTLNSILQNNQGAPETPVPVQTENPTLSNIAATLNAAARQVEEVPEGVVNEANQAEAPVAQAPAKDPVKLNAETIMSVNPEAMNNPSEDVAMEALEGLGIY